MDLALSDDHKSIVELAEGFGRTLRAAARTTEKDGPGELENAYAELAFLKMDWPESAGGFDGGSFGW